MMAIAGAGAATATPALAASSGFEGTWTVTHGGTGQITINADGTYVSTCAVRDGYSGYCPDPTGTFVQGFGGSSSYVTFTGATGGATYRWAGPVGAPTSMATGGLSGLIIDRGTAFVCSECGENAYQLARTPLVYVDANDDVFAVGSNQNLGPRTADNYVLLAETAPNYFVEGTCSAGGGGGGGGTTTPVLHVGDLDGRGVLSGKNWQAQVTISVVNASGQPVPGATVTARWGSGTSGSCVTGANGTCTLSSPKMAKSVSQVNLSVTGVTLSGSSYAPTANTDPDGDSNGTTITVRRP